MDFKQMVALRILALSVGPVKMLKQVQAKRNTALYPCQPYEVGSPFTVIE